MLKNIISILIIGLTSHLIAGKQPNILFIFADDMAFETIGAYGHTNIKTPHLDKLVSNGMSFTHTYNMGAWGGAVCVASRTMLNSGRFVNECQVGIKNNPQ